MDADEEGDADVKRHKGERQVERRVKAKLPPPEGESAAPPKRQRKNKVVLNTDQLATVNTKRDRWQFEEADGGKKLGLPGSEDDSESLDWDTSDNTADILIRLLSYCGHFRAPFESGAVLNIDLSGFVNHLYAFILPVSLLPQIDAPPLTEPASNFRISKAGSVVDTLFRALNVVFSPRSSGGIVVPWRSAAFAKRLLIASTI
ncbi:hypothetical protein BKA82DRAFT_25877 [Pisolithus tinctorius]|uniref:Uncharacterized protein n=1 Tax=Pisolithus tinctorius Marx 270 TaxID=870435 RepID=A0A0C3PAV3_PISTI|nr:hypothetical protein BKA82DRAFT_25877 [Pisolithus tinctorius]KIO04769.1 hypothetical protein M404DRAFT_25877 [Pisolithus tinctorius Marx 270]